PFTEKGPMQGFLASCHDQAAGKRARAFRRQEETPAHRELLADTAAWLEPRSDQRWLDLACGAGALSRLLLRKAEGRLAELVGLDAESRFGRAYEHMRARFPFADEARFRFQAADLERGIPFADAHFHGVVSGLALHYAESFNSIEKRWTREGYDDL